MTPSSAALFEAMLAAAGSSSRTPEHPSVVLPPHPFECGQFKRHSSFPGRATVDQFRLAKTVGGLCQQVVTVTPAHRQVDVGFGQALGYRLNPTTRRPPVSAMLSQV